jgi:hypothetical protein
VIYEDDFPDGGPRGCAGIAAPSFIPNGQSRGYRPIPHHVAMAWSEAGWDAPPPPAEVLEATSVAHPGTPDLMSILTPRKEPLMLVSAPERLALTVGERTALPAPEAPHGVKLDGKPRKSRAGRKPKAKPKAKPAPVVREPDPVREAIEVAALIELPAPAVTSLVHLTASPLLARIVSDIDAEIARLQQARARLLAVPA